MRARKNCQEPTGTQLEMFGKVRLRPANDDDCFASSPRLPKSRFVTKGEVERARQLHLQLAQRSLTLRDLASRVGPANYDAYCE